MEPDDTSEYCILPPWDSGLDEILIYMALERTREGDYAAVALGRPTYAELKSALMAWAAREAGGGRRDFRGFDRVMSAKDI